MSRKLIVALQAATFLPTVVLAAKLSPIYVLLFALHVIADIISFITGRGGDR